VVTAIIISLLSDRQADADDQLPPGSTDRKGWWGDAYLDPLPDGSADLLGSKLWLRQRALATTQTQLAIETDISQALAWMLADNVAVSVQVTSQFLSATALSVTITIAQTLATGQTASRSFNAIWNFTLGQLFL